MKRNRFKTAAVLFGMVLAILFLLFLPRIAEEISNRSLFGSFEDASEAIVTLPQAGMELPLARNLYISHRYLEPGSETADTAADYAVFLRDVAELKRAGVLPRDYEYGADNAAGTEWVYPFRRESRSGAVVELRWEGEAPVDLETLQLCFREYLGISGVSDWERVFLEQSNLRSLSYYSPATCLYVTCSENTVLEQKHIFLSVVSLTHGEFYKPYF